MVHVSEIVGRLADRKGVTEADIQSDVRALLLYGGLDLEEKDLVVLEAQVGGGRRIDVEIGATAIEVKKSLASDDAHANAADQLAGYLRTRTAETGQRYAGILTDGVLWELYHLAADGAAVANSLRLRGESADTEALTVWIEGVLATAQGISPMPNEIHRRLGARSSSFALDFIDLREIYAQHKHDTEVALKRELWSRLLSSALGTHFPDTDELFVLHTYLVISAELIAHTAVGLPVVGQPPRALLTGEVFRSAQLGGVVEADFFDWPADTELGQRFIRELARRIARFDWSNVDHDVLKALYESVIDAETRKQLGEYYTPDWLAEGMVAATVTVPLEQRVLDPACGSGTFLFWAVRRYLAAADAAGRSNEEAITGLVSHVAGIDLHPVAVALARVTYVLAIGGDRLQGQRPPFSVPVYLGDSVRWEQDETLLAKGGITIYTTDGAELFDRELHFPERVVSDAGRFDQLVAELADRASKRAPASGIPKIDAILNRLAIRPEDGNDVRAAFRALCDLHDQGRNHIWGYYVRNLARPLWFTQPDNRVDVLVGNPPWLAYRFMPDHMQQLYRAFSEQRGMWAGGKVSTHQDLSDLFVVRCVEHYLRGGGRFAFVMPAAALSRRQFVGFRTGSYEALGVATAVDFDTPWDLRGVSPDIFPVPASVVFGKRAGTPRALPQEARRLTGRIAPRGTRWSDAEERLKTARVSLERGADDGIVSAYAQRFYQGAILLPRVLVTVRELPSGPLGTPTGTRRVESLRSALEKAPWKDIESLEGGIEEPFLRPTYLGASIAPFRALDRVVLSIIPWTGGELLDGSDPRLDEYPGLAAWWRSAEGIWEAKRSDSTRLSLKEQLDYYGKLSGQFPLQPHRVLYTKSGNRITACRLDDQHALIDHTLYWATVQSIEEGQYLVAVLNSDAVHEKIEPLMSEGLFGKRHIDKYVFAVPFPVYNPDAELHVKLAEAGARAEEVAASVELDAGVTFQRARRLVRDGLASNGVAGDIENLVSELLSPIPVPV
jgi:SAM-dependent methyltransferase